MKGRRVASRHGPGRTPRRLRRTGALVLCAAAVAAPGAAAQQQQPRDREPTAEELWKAYPLDDGTAPPVPTREATRASTRAGDRVDAADDDDGRGVAVPLAVVLGAVAAGGFVLLRRRARAEPGAAPSAEAPARPEPGLPQPPALPLLAREAPMTPAGRFRRASPHPRPPEPQRPWDADVRWEQESGSGHFLAVACSADGGEAELLRSEPIPWPPTTDGAQAMKQAVEAIDATLLEAGWQPRPKGDAWYARRYAWAPEQPAPSRNGSAPAAVGVSARREAAPRPRARAVAAPETTRRRRAPSPSTAADPWTDAALQLTGLPQIPDAGTRWSCRIRWNAGWRSSRFEAVAMPPGRKRGPRIATSTEFQWTFKADPDPALPAVRAAVAALRSELLAAGWEPAGIGRQWYAHRFVWTGDGDPPDAVSGGGSPAA